MDSEAAVTVFLFPPAGHSLLSSIARRGGSEQSLRAAATTTHVSLSRRIPVRRGLQHQFSDSLRGPLGGYERQFDIDMTGDPCERRQHGERRPVEQQMALDPQDAVVNLDRPDVERTVLGVS